MAEKYVLRDPDYIDLSGGWKLQPRDLRGRWARSSASMIGAPRPLKTPNGKPQKKVFSKEFDRLEANRQAPAQDPLRFYSRESHTHVEARELDRGEVRQSLSLDHTERQHLFESAGLKTEFKESETELIHKWHESSSAKEKARIEHEMMVRQKALTVALSTVREAQVLAGREQKRNAMQRFDDHLKGSKVGKALLGIRDRMMSDKAFDRSDKAKEGIAEYGKDWVKHLATSRLTSTLIAMSVGLSGHFFGDQMPEAVRAFAENPIAEAGLAAAAGLALAFGVKMLHKGTKKGVQKVKAKAVARKGSPDLAGRMLADTAARLKGH